ncbi:MAG: DUF3568 family protein [Planctomycetia bacterium]|nr:DUF3568 family protein [Planctomycetia bacterium]
MRRYPTRYSWYCLCVAALALGNTGCLLVAAGAAAGGGVAAYQYAKGNVCHQFKATFEDSWIAVRTSLTELGMTVLTEERKGTGKGIIESRAGDGSSVTITLEATPSAIPAEGVVTEVCIRVGTWGNYGISDRIMGQVNTHLAPAGAAPNTSTTAPPAQGWVPAQMPPTTAPPPLLAPEPAKQ